MTRLGRALGRSGVRGRAGWGGGLGRGEKREGGSGLGRRVGLLGWVGFPSSFSFPNYTQIYLNSN